MAWRPFNPEKPEGIHVYIIKGDPSKGAFSALVKMPPGAKAPLHIHSADYVGVSLTDGFVSGADEATAAMLPKFSSWVQPGGASHFNACQSEAPCVFMVSFKGAVDMKPVEAAVEGTFEKKETAGDAIPWKVVREGMENSPKMFVIHGNPKEGAFEAIFWFPPGMSTNIHTHSASFAAAVLQGEHHRGESAEAVKALGPGSVWHEVAGSPHMEKCAGPEACIFAVSFDGPLDTQNVELTTE
ncbi:MAG: DUF4437 domain-containing protein [Myxococcota bacterium]